MSEENKAIVDRYIDEVMNNRNFSIFNDLFSPDFANHSPRLGIMGREATSLWSENLVPESPTQ